jgi:hypothetical protein
MPKIFPIGMPFLGMLLTPFNLLWHLPAQVSLNNTGLARQYYPPNIISLSSSKNYKIDQGKITKL